MYKSNIINLEHMHSLHLNREVKLGFYFNTQENANDVLICFDGQDFQNMGQIHRAYESLQNQNAIRNALIVFVHYPNIETRKREYHPEGDNQDKMCKFIVKELLPYIEQHFKTHKSVNHRLLLGDSLAASIALQITLDYPSTFKKACLFSPMIVPKHFTQFHNQDYYIIVGEEEFDFKLKTGESADFLTPIQAIHEHLNQQGLPHYYSERSGNHTWKVWKPQIEHVLKYFLS